MESSYTSRKFVISIVAIIAALAVPIAFKLLDISDSITMASLGFIFSSATAYGILNVQADKVAAAKAPNV